MPPGLPRLVRDGLLAAEEEVRPGATGAGGGPGDRAPRGRGPREGRETQEEAIRRLAGDISSFRLRLGLDRVVVVNVASPGPDVPRHPAHASLPALRRALAAGEDVLSDGSLYACAALRADCPYVDLTAPAGLRLPALRELAAERELPYAGGGGRTGGALLKSVLAPVLAQRALAVNSWSDGRTDGRDGDEGGDEGGGSGRRAARDQVSFEGFLGVPMALRFTWQGCGPALAAPLVLDLARLMALADRAGVRGPVPELAFFFQEPLREPVPGGAPGGDRRSPGEQYATLVAWAHGLRVPV
jgi:myo-inositol-1-phosphate synthase